MTVRGVLFDLGDTLTRPQECLVVDDDPALVAAAIALGYRGAAVDRAGVIAAGRVRTIASIDDVLDLVHDPDR